MKANSDNLSICIFADGYPTKEDPSFAFIRPLVCSFADKGIKCTVIAPRSITRCAKRTQCWRKDRVWLDTTANGSVIAVHQPGYLSVSRFKLFGIPVSQFFFKSACLREYRRLSMSVNVTYGHFWRLGAIACEAAKGSVRSFAASGESNIEKNLSFSVSQIKKRTEGLSGVIYVSSKNREESLRLGLDSGKMKSIVAPNGHNPSEFYPMNKVNARKMVGVDDYFTVIFVGAFNERKGVNRLSEALSRLEGIQSIFIGSGLLPPHCPGAVIVGEVSHFDLVSYLNAADVFVLPTLAEGCCNAIVEALACGLPVVSSDLSFNDDILDDSCSIRIDPTRVDQISEAISRLRDDQALVSSLSRGALKKAKGLSIDSRSDAILEFILDDLELLE